MGSRINIYSVELVKESGKIYDVSRQIKTPDDSYDIIEHVLSLSSKTKEHFTMMSLDTKNKVIGVHTIHIGQIDSSIVHPREVYQQAILNNAKSIMVFHNHPSGDPAPSNEDIRITRRIKEAGDIIGIELLDHLIIGDPDHRYTSLADKGYV